ncbi:hypothetical protein ACLOJK_014493 [Asimina triloba]
MQYCSAFDDSRLVAPLIVSLGLEQSPAHLHQVCLPHLSHYFISPASLISSPSLPLSPSPCLPHLSPVSDPCLPHLSIVSALVSAPCLPHLSIVSAPVFSPLPPSSLPRLSRSLHPPVSLISPSSLPHSRSMFPSYTFQASAGKIQFFKVAPVV